MTQKSSPLWVVLGGHVAAISLMLFVLGAAWRFTLQITSAQAAVQAEVAAMRQQLVGLDLRISQLVTRVDHLVNQQHVIHRASHPGSPVRQIPTAATDTP